MKQTDSSGDRYVPIACTTHSHLELHILHRHRLRLRWHEGNIWRDQVILPLDLQTRRGEEFLIGQLPSGEEVRIRLDRLTHVARA